MSTIPKNEFYEPEQEMDEIEVEGLGTFDGVKILDERIPSYREWRLAANIASRLLAGRGVDSSNPSYFLSADDPRSCAALKQSVEAAKEIIRLSKYELRDFPRWSEDTGEDDVNKMFGNDYSHVYTRKRP
jgi:hypothetical protein